MAKQQQDEPKLEARPRGQWECGIDGRCGADDPQNENVPEIRITTTAWVASDTGETLGYTCEAFRRDWHTSPIEWASIAEPGQRERNQIDAWNGAKLDVIKFLREQYREELHADPFEYGLIMNARDLLLVVRGELGREGARIREKARPEFEAVEGDDLLFCLKLADQHFAALETAANVYFRLRLSPDGEPWSSGKDRHNNKIVIPGKSEKTSPEKADLLQPVLGWTPDFIVTICNETWKDAKPEQRGGIVHHLLTQCGIADEKFFIAKPEFAAFGSTVKALGPEAVPGATIFVHDAIEGARRMDQLDLFRELEHGMDAREMGAKAEKIKAVISESIKAVETGVGSAAKKFVKGMQRNLGPDGSVVISSGSKAVEITQAGVRSIDPAEAMKRDRIEVPSEEPTEPQPASAEVLSISTEPATDERRFDGDKDEDGLLDEPDFDAGYDAGFVDGFAEPEPEPLPPVEDASTDPADDLIMDAVKLACTARVGSPGIIAKARENGANDTDLRHIVCLAFGMGSASRTMGDHLVLFVGKNNDPTISISETKTKAAVRTISGAELLALVRLGFGIDAPQGAKRGAVKSAVATV
jgi:hypothetical protein